MRLIAPRIEAEIPLPLEQRWDAPLPRPSVGPSEYSEVASLLLLNSADLPSKNATTPRDLLRLGADDPDHGMDRDLPDSADPNDDRKYMGGSRGTGSSGFRHMYWSGWNWRKPLTTFQIPTRRLGQSPDRIELLANEARDRIRKGDYYWGYRILGWTIHYIQDLTQPFHAVELPSLRMIPMRSLLTWPISEIFPSLVRETTRTITNYHWAYEGYVRQALIREGGSPLRTCLETGGIPLVETSPRSLAFTLIRNSIERAPMTGESIYRLVGSHLKDDEISIPLNPRQIDVEGLQTNPQVRAARENLERVTCDSLRLSAHATLWITKWAIRGPREPR